MTRTRWLESVVIGVCLVAFACERGRVDTELEVLPTTPPVSIHRLSKFSPCVGSMLERTTCRFRGAPKRSCIYGLVHTNDKPARPIDCEMVSGWAGPETDDSPYGRLPSADEKSASGTTFMIREPGVEQPFEYRYMEVPDAGLRISVKVGSWPFSRTHHHRAGRRLLFTRVEVE